MSDPQVTYFDKAELYVRRAEEHWQKAEEISKSGEWTKLQIEFERDLGDRYMARAVQYAAVSQAQLFETLLLYLEKRAQKGGEFLDMLRSLGSEEEDLWTGEDGDQ